jgi:hypothetical protein
LVDSETGETNTPGAVGQSGGGMVGCACSGRASTRIDMYLLNDEESIVTGPHLHEQLKDVSICIAKTLFRHSFLNKIAYSSLVIVPQPDRSTAPQCQRTKTPQDAGTGRGTMIPSPRQAPVLHQTHYHSVSRLLSAISFQVLYCTR